MSSSPIECLVTWKGRKQVLLVNGDHKKSDVIDAAMLTESWTSLQCDRIEVYNSRFETYVEVSEEHIFCDGDKINLVASDSCDEESLPLKTGTNDGPSVVASCSSGFQQMHYELPPVPVDIKFDIDRTTLGEVSSRTKSRIVSWITSHLLQVDLYPGKFYEPAARALVLKYPVLRDTMGTGFDSWRVAFKYKMCNIRKSVDNNPKVEEARKKFCRKGNFQDKCHPKKQCRLSTGALETRGEEDDGVVAAHIEFMIKEVKRSTPDIAKLKASMKATFSSRRKWIQESSPSTAVLLERYPALALRELLRQQFMSITQVDFESKLLNFINTHGERCLQLLKMSRTAKSALAEAEQAISEAEGDLKKYYFAVAVLQLLPHLVKEQPNFLRGPDSYPSLVMNNKALIATEICTTFESYKVEVIDLISGTSALMELYWIMNIQYSSRNKNTFALMEHFCGLNSAARSPLVMRAISLIEKV
uniref:Uncharacterized protein n=1 Tax=Amblyomma maculatum TaxID=34609 RepID=G3ML60_AMBMU